MVKVVKEAIQAPNTSSRTITSKSKQRNGQRGHLRIKTDSSTLQISHPERSLWRLKPRNGQSQSGQSGHLKIINRCMFGHYRRPAFWCLGARNKSNPAVETRATLLWYFPNVPSQTLLTCMYVSVYLCMYPKCITGPVYVCMYVCIYILMYVCLTAHIQEECVCMYTVS